MFDITHQDHLGYTHTYSVEGPVVSAHPAKYSRDHGKSPVLKDYTVEITIDGTTISTITQSAPSESAAVSQVLRSLKFVTHE